MKMRWVLSATAALLGSLSAIAQPTDEINNWAAPPYWMPQQAATLGTSRPGGRSALASGREKLVATTASTPMPFVAVAPCRVADTRVGSGFAGDYGQPALQAQATRAFVIVGQCGIPADAQAVSFLFTAVNMTATGNFRAWASGAPMPAAGGVVVWAATTPYAVENSAIVPIGGVPGAVNFYLNGALGSSADLVIDVNGYYAPMGVANNWGVIARNTIGSPVGVLRAGPFGSFGVVDAPPSGVGSLGIEVADGTAKIAFGNEVDFYGQSVSGLTAVGFSVYTTGENSALGSPNMPSITLEINPAGAGGTSTTYSSLVWTPAANSTPNGWSGYIDATTTGFWGLTGGQFNSPATLANCGLNGPRCTFAQVQAFLASGTGATIYSVAVAKGRDFAWQGAVDGLRINGMIYDFEPLGVKAVPAP